MISQPDLKVVRCDVSIMRQLYFVTFEMNLYGKSTQLITSGRTIMEAIVDAYDRCQSVSEAA